MSDFDPKYRDPNRLNELEPSPDYYAREAGGYWGWIIGGVAALALLFTVLSFTRDDTQTTADSGMTNPPAAAQPANPRPMTPPAANAPAQQAPSTTGQSSQ